MNTEPKIRLTVYTEGGSLVRKGVETRKGVILKKEVQAPGTYTKADGNKIVKKFKYTVPVYEKNESTRTIQMCQEAYNWMSSNEAPRWFKDKKLWSKMSTVERIDKHCEYIAKSYDSTKYIFKILDD